MSSFVMELFGLLTEEQKSKFFMLQFLMILMALMEIVGVASIAPFMSLVGNVEMLEGDNLLADVYRFLGFEHVNDFLLLLGTGVLVALTVSSLFSVFTTWRISLYASHVGTEIADSLYDYYLKQEWLFHSERSTAQLTKQVATEATRVSNGVIMPLMQINARIILALFISLAIFIYDPVVASVGLLIFVIAYYLVYRVVRNKLKRNGKVVSSVMATRFRLMNEGFGGIKDLLLLGRQQSFIGDFSRSGKKLAYAIGANSAIGLMPRYLMELVAFGSLIALILFLITYYEGDLSHVLPILAVYALAGFKLLPALQQSYVSFSTLKGNTSAYEAIKSDLKAAREYESTQKNNTEQTPLTLEDSIKLENIKFSYPHSSSQAIRDLSLEIKANQTVGIVGHSGSGKSTLIDILLCLLPIDEGELIIDGGSVNSVNKAAWQKLIGFVPQSIFLTEGTIAENVAFGMHGEDIDMEKVIRAIKLSHLEELVDSLPDGLQTTVGERGVRLSGGQRQRIGIARALYNDPKVLIFDEATSALDGITEKMIMRAINDFSGNKTIIMIAHRLKTVQKCDVIFMMEKGKVIDSGTYQELSEHNASFQEMANHA